MMRRSLQSTISSRAIAIGLALLAHVLLLLLLLFGMRSPLRVEVEPIQFVSLWPDLSPPAPNPEPPDLPPPDPPYRAKTRSPLPDPETEVSTAITLLPPIDWQREGIDAARRAAEPKGPETFSAPPRTARKRCEPPESSFVWNPEIPRAGFTRTPIPLPFVRLGERCIVGLGFFACTMGELPEANSHLFDDVKEGKTTESSVPDPNICD